MASPTIKLGTYDVLYSGTLLSHLGEVVRIEIGLPYGAAIATETLRLKLNFKQAGLLHGGQDAEWRPDGAAISFDFYGSFMEDRAYGPLFFGEQAGRQLSLRVVSKLVNTRYYLTHVVVAQEGRS
jgi:hypothetical protein